MEPKRDLISTGKFKVEFKRRYEHIPWSWLEKINDWLGFLKRRNGGNGDLLTKWRQGGVESDHWDILEYSPSSKKP